MDTAFNPPPQLLPQRMAENPSRTATQASAPSRSKALHSTEIGSYASPVSALLDDGPVRQVRFGSTDDVFESALGRDVHFANAVSHHAGNHDNSTSPRSRTRRENNWVISLPNILYYAIAYAVLLAAVQKSPFVGTSGLLRIGVSGSVITSNEMRKSSKSPYVERQDSSIDTCTRWSQQTAIVNGTLYMYGGRAKDDPDQTSNTWNNDFLTLDVSKSWDISSPALSGLPQPSGPPPVANGYIWHSFQSLFLYGGEYSQDPVTSPEPYSLWEYEIGASKWTEHDSPKTSAGKASDGGNQDVQPAAEGAGISVPSLGRGFYFGGHQDGYTTAGWSQSIPRIYLKSMVEFTFPGSANDAVSSLQGGKTAGDDGVWRNITEGGLQESNGFTKRADGIFVYVPGFSAQGIILGLAGGTNVSFTQMNVIDVYDVANSTWYKQATQGDPPKIRVNPCAVAASAPDGSSTNIYMYGGQNLIPYDEQTQYDDMWVLTVPSFTWIKVDASDGNPPARAGHACEVWDGQMIVVGGYVGKDLTCDSPGIYVFNMSSLKWQTSFTALQGANDQSQQVAQAEDKAGEQAGLAGSYGYQVPKAVQDVIGGNDQGGATVTAPAVTASAGPLKTGGPITYTVTADGGTVTQTSGAGGPNSSTRGSSGPNIGAIVAGVVAGIFAVLAGYLGFCAYVYRRQLNLYKNHVAAAQRAAIAPPGEETGFLAGAEKSSGLSSSRGPNSSSANNNPSLSSSAARGSAPYHSDEPRPSDANSDDGELQLNQEPSFIGVMMSPRKSLRVINRD